MTDLIKQVVLSPTLWAAVEFYANAEAATYRVTATATAGSAPPIVATSTTPIVRVGPTLWLGTTYALAPEIVLVGGGTVTGTAENLAALPDVGYGELLRQRICDLLAWANLTVRGAAVDVVRDKHGMAEILRGERPISSRGPFVEVGFGVVTSAKRVGSRSAEIWEVPLGLLDSTMDERDAVITLGRLWETVRRTVDATANLGLAGCGVIDGSWEWRFEKEPMAYSQMIGWDGTLVVPVQRISGAGLWG